MAAARLCTLALDQGLALYTRRTSGGAYGEWVMLTPPLIIDAAEVDELAERLEASLRVFERELEARGVLP
jgi:4-aminobutyrate aminotransferase-like enzyme